MYGALKFYEWPHICLEYKIIMMYLQHIMAEYHIVIDVLNIVSEKF